MTWQRVLDVVDAIESWIAGQSYWVQVLVLLAVLGPLCWLLAGLIDRVVEAVLAWHSRRDQVTAGPPAAVSAGGHRERRRSAHRGRPMSRRPLPVLTRRWMTVALLALVLVAIVVALTR